MVFRINRMSKSMSHREVRYSSQGTVTGWNIRIVHEMQKACGISNLVKVCGIARVVKL